MTEENTQDESPAPDAIAPETEPTESSTVNDEATQTPADDTGTEKPRDDKGRFVGVQGRIDQLTWEKNEERRLRESLERELVSYRQPKAEPVQEVKQPGTLEEFGFDEVKHRQAWSEYTSALVDSRVEAKLTERETAQKTTRVQQTFRQKEAAFIAKTPDYAETAYKAPISDSVAHMVMDSDLGPEIAYELGKNPEMARQISSLSTVAAARAIGRIEARIEANKSTPPPPKVSTAPPPPPKIAATDASVSVKPTEAESDKLSNDEWMRARNKQVQRKR